MVGGAQEIVLKRSPKPIPLHIVLEQALAAKDLTPEAEAEITERIMAEIDVILARLEVGIAAQRRAMGRLLKELRRGLPENRRSQRRSTRQESDIR